jgi:hypothetical protein
MYPQAPKKCQKVRVKEKNDKKCDRLLQCKYQLVGAWARGILQCNHFKIRQRLVAFIQN